jgi:hypothetical protein
VDISPVPALSEAREADVAECEVCGNEYDKAFLIRATDGSEHIFDSFECAVHRLAPRCEHCDCKIIGHGEEVDGHMFCCAHCARHAQI